MSTLARWCYRHRFLTMLIWVGILIGLMSLSQAVKRNFSSSFALPGTGSYRAQQLLQQAAPAQAGDIDRIVWHVSHGTVRDPAVVSRLSATMKNVARVPEVAGVVSPYSQQGAAQISKDGRTAYAQVGFTKSALQLNKADVKRYAVTAEAARAPGLDVQLSGQAAGSLEQGSLSSASTVGLAAAAVILALAFASFWATWLPIITAVTALTGGIYAIAPLTHVLEVNQFAPLIAGMIGLGVGVDYALFILTRHRRGLLSGMSPEDAAAKAAATSGRAVVFAGATVCISLLGVFIVNVKFLNGLAVTAAMTVLFTLLAAITLLPAMLGVFKIRVLSRRQRRRLRDHGPQPAEATQGLWARWSRTVEKRPVVLGVIATAVVLILSVPVLHLRLGSSDQSNNPSSSTTFKAYALLSNGFGPGFNGALELAAQAPSGADRAAMNQLLTRLPAVPGVASVSTYPARPGTGVEVAQVIPETSPESKATSGLVTRLRNSVVPQYTRGTTLRVYVGGQVALNVDLAKVVGSKLPWFLTAIIASSCLLLMFAFRSVIIPATGALMNLLAAAASFGVLNAMFGWGWGSNSLGLGKGGPIDSFLPPMMLAILFGLSMDYQVFLISRMSEEWAHTRRGRRAVRAGVTETARVITAAAAIMICVFTAFIFNSQRVVSEFGVELAAAVLLDAFILRTVLVPAVMHMIGDANWWLPRWLDRRLPHLALEAPGDLPAEPTQTRVAARQT